MQNLKKILKNKKGFTLVELMVVVAIMGILVAIAVPTYSSVTASAAKKTCDSNVKTLNSAVAVVKAENNGVLPEDFEIADLQSYVDLDSLVCPVNGTTAYTMSGDEVVCTNCHPVAP